MNGDENEPASKADLAAVKTELKFDISRLDAKVDSVEKRLDRKIDKVAMELVKTQGHMVNMEERLAKLITEGNSRVLKTVEDFAVQVQKIDRREIITSHRVDGLETQVKSLESSR